MKRIVMGSLISHKIGQCKRSKRRNRRSIERIFILTRKAEKRVTFKFQMAVIAGNTIMIYGLNNILYYPHTNQH